MKLILSLCAALLYGSVQAAPHLPPDSSQALDLQLAATLQSLSTGNMPEARVLARQTAEGFPDSALAQLLSAELSAMSAHQTVRAADPSQMSRPLQALLQEARVRLQSHANLTGSPIEQQLPREVIQLGKDVSTLLVADLSAYTLYHIGLNQQLPTLLQQHYIGAGKAGFGKRSEGDNKTPQGLYNIDGQRSDASLPDLYGAGALTLDYPNALDRELGRTGSGIWLHGVPRNQQNRAPLSSEGCVTMSNDHFIALRQRLFKQQEHTNLPEHVLRGSSVVLLTHAVQWVDMHQQREEQAHFQDLFSRYQRAWDKRSLAEVLNIYESLDLALEKFERLDNIDNTPLSTLGSVDKRNISIFRNPRVNSNSKSDKIVPEKQYVVMRMQTGRENENLLTLYWVLDDDGQWRVVTEQWNIVNS